MIAVEDPTAVQTLAPEPDLFEALPAAPADDNHVATVLEIHGVLLRSAVVSNKMVGEDHHLVPVLCMEIRPTSGIKRTIIAHQVFSEATRHLAEEKAKAMKRGTHVTFRTCLTDMRTLFPHVRQVAISPPPL